MSDLERRFKSSDPEYLDRLSIDSVSFVPTDTEIEILLLQSREAVKAAENHQPGTLLSKNPDILEGSTLNPDDTVLNTDVLQGALQSGQFVELKENYLYAINDRAFPFIENSNGPNGILVECQKKYGKYRINLFHQNRASTLHLLSDYLHCRNKCIRDLFVLFVSKMSKHLDPTEDYAKVTEMFNWIAQNIDDTKQTLKDYGIGVVSFCQTWMRDGNEYGSAKVIGPAQFSVMSPHFQTRFYVKSSSKLQTYVGQEYIKAYTNVIAQFTRNMQLNYGKYDGGAGSAFINMDKLYHKLKGGKKSRKKKSGKKSGKKKSRKKSVKKSPKRSKRRSKK